MAVIAVAAVCAGIAATPAGAAVTAAHGVPSGAGFTAVAPVRVLDTRIGLGAPEGTVLGDSSLRLNLARYVPASATAVVFTLTAVFSEARPTPQGTVLTVWPAGRPRPATSNLNLPAAPGSVASDLVTSALGANRSVDIFNSSVHEHVAVMADLAGYYTPGTGAGYTVANPARRVLDTRSGLGTTAGPVRAHTTRTLDLTGKVPAGTTAVTINVTATDVRANSYVTVWPDDERAPTVSQVSTPAGRDTAGLVTVAVAPDLKVDLLSGQADLDLVVDLVGFYHPGTGAGFTPVTGDRALDTRTGTAARPLAAGTPRLLDLTGQIPADSSSVLMTMTGVNASTSTFVRTWPALGAEPGTSNLNLAVSQAQANMASVAVTRTSKSLLLLNNAGHTDLVADVAGYFGPTG